MIEVAKVGLIVMLLIFLLLHFAVLLKLLPYSIVWGDRIKNDTEMYQSESVSILLNLILLWIAFEVFTLSNWILPKESEPYLLTGMAILFFINSIGNIRSKNKVERFIFTPCALILSLFCAVIVWG